MSEIRDGPLYLHQRLEEFATSAGGAKRSKGIGEMSLTTLSTDVAVTRVVPGSVGTAERFVHAVVEGAGFNETTTFELTHDVHESTMFVPVETHVIHSTRVELVLDLEDGVFMGLPAPVEEGLYWLQVGHNGEPSSELLVDALEITASEEIGVVTFDLDTFGSYRAGQLSIFTLQYANVGATETPAPIFRFEGSERTEFKLASDDDFTRRTLLVTGVDRDNAAGALAPTGERHDIPVFFRAESREGIEIQVSLFQPELDSDGMAWSETERPTGISEAL